MFPRIPRYLAGSNLVKSEIVIPIYVKKNSRLKLDIESYFTDTFPQSEQGFIGRLRQLLADYLSKNSESRIN